MHPAAKQCLLACSRSPIASSPTHGRMLSSALSSQAGAQTSSHTATLALAAIATRATACLKIPPRKALAPPPQASAPRQRFKPRQYPRPHLRQLPSPPPPLQTSACCPTAVQAPDTRPAPVSVTSNPPSSLAMICYRTGAATHSNSTRAKTLRPASRIPAPRCRKAAPMPATLNTTLARASTRQAAAARCSLGARIATAAPWTSARTS